MAPGVLVTICWDSEIIAVRRIARGAAILGWADGSISRLPAAALGARSWTVATVHAQGASLHPPPNADVRIRRSSKGGGFATLQLAAGDAAAIALGRFSVTIEVLGREDVRPLPRSRSLGAAIPWVAFAAVVHVGVLGWARAAPATSSADDSWAQREEMRHRIAAAERRASAAPDLTTDGAGISEGARIDDRPGDGARSGGARAATEEGATGAPLSRALGKRFSAHDHRAGAAPARETGDTDFTSAMVGLLAASAGAPSAAFGAELASADDPLSSLGSMWAPTLGESLGGASLGLSGLGVGGGGEGEGVGLGAIGTLGHGAGLAGTSTGGAGSRKHVAKVPRIRCYGGCNLGGVVPPEAVQRVIRQNMGRVRFCYEEGLRHNPSLSGRVTTRFLIRRDGIVGAVQTTESTLGDRGVEDCVARVFGSLSFPPPEHSTLTVVYPIMMSSAEPERAALMSFSD